MFNLCRIKSLLTLGAILFTSLLSGCSPDRDASAVSAAGDNTVRPLPQPLPAPHYVGGQHCRDCHSEAFNHWQGSHHDLAMQEATVATVLGDFDQARFTYHGVTTEFYRKDDQFWIHTDGPDGQLSDFAVRYVFGVYPLQQYLLELPGGRLQAFGIAWDSRPASEGGQRWFHLYPDESITYNDPLHWSGRLQNWNFMCAECHSTHLKKNFDEERGVYNTTWSEIDVSCEACHGPASNHLLWADEKSRTAYSFGSSLGLTHLFNEREGVSWSHNAEGQPQRSRPNSRRKELPVCAACHSRRAQMFEDDRKGQAFTDSYLPATLDPGLYHADGQVDAEVYVYGSFVQSKMFAAGVTCSDCHNPHSLQLKVPGDGVCLQCHTPEHATEQHHHHRPGSEGARCVNCHMPSKHFMVVDERRDHSFRVPRPDLSVELGVPNACNQCHRDQTAGWAASAVQAWLGRPARGYQQFAHTLAQARAYSPGADRALRDLLADTGQPPIARATAASALQRWLNQENVGALASALSDPQAQVRLAALQSLGTLPPNVRWQLLSPLLDDTAAMVRAMAASQLADIPLTELPAAGRQRLQRALELYRSSLTFNADTPEAQVNIGRLEAQRGNFARAEQAYQKALKLDDTWLPVYINLADLYRQMDRDDLGRPLLESALQRFPDAAPLHHSLGLLLTRQKDREASLQHLAQAARLAPELPRYQYVYAVALHSAGRQQEALQHIDQTLARYDDPSLRQLRQQLAPSDRQVQ